MIDCLTPAQIKEKLISNIAIRRSCPSLLFYKEVIGVLSWILPFRVKNTVFEGMTRYPRVIMNKNANITFMLISEILKQDRFKKIGFNISEVGFDVRIAKNLKQTNENNGLEFGMNTSGLPMSKEAVKNTLKDFVIYEDEKESCQYFDQDIHLSSESDSISFAVDYIYMIASIFNRYISNNYLGKSRASDGYYHRNKSIDIFEVFKIGNNCIDQSLDFLKDLIASIPDDKMERFGINSYRLRSKIISQFDDIGYIDIESL